MINAAVAASLLLAVSCSNDDDEDVIPTNNELVTLTGDLSTQTLTKDKKYLLVGQVFVRDGQTLTVEPGTIIFGDKRTRGVLVVDRGGRMIAEGTAAEPIVMTSNQEEGVRDRGDWGGLVILGRAETNQPNPAIEGITPEVNFGGNNNEDNSGVYKYLRVEFGGIELTPNNETNSITMGGVGRGTLMEYCQVSFGGDDGFEWFGGNINGKYLISTAMWDDDFDCDFGWSGNVQFGLVVRYPGFADQSQSNAFECDNGPNDNDVTPYTTGTFSNVTVVGPIREGDRISNNNYAHAIDLRRRTAISIFNSVFTGFPRGLRMNQPSVYDHYTVTERGVLKNNVLLAPAPANAFLAGSGVDAAAVGAYWNGQNTTIDGPQTLAQLTALGLDPSIFYGPQDLASAYPSNPNLTVTSGTLASGADFSDPKFSESNRTGYFDNVPFIGAFGANNWAAGWAEFDPVDRVY